MNKTNADQFRSNMKEWMETARKEPVKITRRSGESFVLINAEIYEKMQLRLARLEGLTASLTDKVQGRTKLFTDELIDDVFAQAKKQAHANRKKKAVG